MLKRRTTYLLALTILSSTVLLGSPSQDQNAFVIVTPSEMPAIIESPTFRNDTGRQLTSITITIKNTSEDDLQDFAVEVYVVNTFGYIVSGEGWVVRDTLPRGATRQYSEPLRSFVRSVPDDKLLVVLRGARNARRTWEVPGSEILRYIREKFPVERPTTDLGGGGGSASLSKAMENCAPAESADNLLKSRPPVALQGCPKYWTCSNKKAEALDVCNSQGCKLCSFSCNETQCSYNFTCCGGACK